MSRERYATFAGALEEISSLREELLATNGEEVFWKKLFCEGVLVNGVVGDGVVEGMSFLEAEGRRGALI